MQHAATSPCVGVFAVGAWNIKIYLLTVSTWISKEHVDGASRGAQLIMLIPVV